MRRACVANGHGVLIGAQPGRPHRARAAHVVDRTVGGERAQALAEPPADRLGPGEQLLVAQDVEVPERGRAGRGVAGVRVAVAEQERRVGFERLAHRGADDHAADLLIAGRDRLGERDHVRRDPEVVRREPGAEAPEPGDHLVEDEQRAVPVAQRAHLGEVAVARWPHAAGALHRLGEHSGDLARRVSDISTESASMSSPGTWITSGTSGPQPSRLGAMPWALVPPRFVPW